MQTPNQDPHTNAAQRLLAVALIGGSLALGACSPEAGTDTPTNTTVTTQNGKGDWATSSVIATTSTSSSGDVITSPYAQTDSTGDSTPTDKLAQDINDANALYDTAGPDIHALPKVDRPSVGWDQITNGVDARIAAADIGLISVPLISDQMPTIKDAVESIARMTDPRGKVLMRKVLTDQVVSSVLQGIKYGDVTASSALKILGSLDKDLAEKYSGVIDTLGVVNAIPGNAKDPEVIKRITTDMPNSSTVKQLSDQYTKASSQKEKDDIYAKIVQLGKAAQVIVDASSNMASADYPAPDMYTDDNRGRLDRAIEDSVKAHNAMRSEVSVQGLAPLAQPRAVIDLRGVLGTKDYYNVQADTTVAGEFGEVYAENGRLVTQFFTDSGLSTKTRAQLTRLIADTQPLLSSAFSSGNVLAVRLVTGLAFGPFFDPNTRTIIMNLGSGIGAPTLSEDEFRSALVHETVHALVNDSYGNTLTISTKDADNINTACSALAGQAYGEFASLLRLDANDGRQPILDGLIARSTPDEKKIFLALKESVNGGTLVPLVEDSVKQYNPDGSKNIMMNSCYGQTMSDVMITLMKKANIKDADLVYADLAKSMKEVSDPNFAMLQDIWNAAMDKYSLYSQLNESNFVQSGSPLLKTAGHSGDNSTELMATLADVTLTHPEQVRGWYLKLDPKDQTIIRMAVGSTYALIIAGHEGLQYMLTPNFARLFSRPQ